AEKIVNLSEEGSKCLINGQYLLHLKIPGIYNIYNALSAISVGLLFELKITDITEMLYYFKSPNMRMEKVTLLNGVTVFNDAYNANPQSMQAALLTFANFSTNGRKIAILGDMCELGEQSISLHRKVGTQFPAGIDILITVGKYAYYIAEEIKKNNKSLELYSYFDINDVCNNVVDIVKNNDKILIKGSRAMKMETILECLKEKYGWKAD
ncbi:MAG: UDP-N-acetylmuramoyl-tripeptide--D-alanyl-D-alanine ligase, partial [candidate division WOR-3 bacterium]|nr:UDP-N-acetylmuramoyl-tripeptide--D-alanyl-D-alanine ligase [candidate division WOR-3 bacterium]